MASRGYCVSVFDSSGESAAHPGGAFACDPGGSGSEFAVGRATSCDEVPSLVQSPPMSCASSLTMLILFWLCSGRWYKCDFFWALVKLSWFLLVAMISRMKWRYETIFGRQRAVVTRRLIPLNGSAPVPFASTSHESSRELFGRAFDKSMYHFR